jgi:hypothetical protein
VPALRSRSAAKLAATGALLLVMGACVPLCGIGAKFALSNAHVDSTYKCPSSVTNHPYDIHGTVDADDSTSNAVTIKSISVLWKLVSVHGDWNIGAVGDHGTDNVSSFSPKSVSSGSTATIRVVFGFSCTSSGPTHETYGDFTISFSVVTTAGTYKLDANKHRLTFITVPA